ncbi:MAG: P-II family nitrogen regulator [Pseudomonadota bacterium]
MRPCKRIEIVVERSQLERMRSVIQTAGATGYTVLMNAGGGGDRGYRRADDVTDTDENCVFIVAVENPDMVSTIVEHAQPIVERYGGLCLVSDALWVRQTEK